MNKLLLSEQKLKSFTSVNKSCDIDLIRAEIAVTQDIHLSQILGQKLLDTLLSRITATGTTWNDSYEETLADMCQNYLIQKSYSEILPGIYAKVGNAGVTTSDNEYAKSVDLKTLQWLRSNQENKASWYRARITEYLTIGDGVGRFPDFDTATVKDGIMPDKTPYQSQITLTDRRIPKGIEIYDEQSIINRIDRVK